MLGKPTGLIDSAPALAHIQKLYDAGLSYNRIAVLAGLRVNMMWRVRQRDQMLARTAAAILAIPIPAVVHEVVAAGQFVDATGTQRRLRGLMVFGYTRAEIAERVGIYQDTVSEILNQQSVRADVACKVSDLFYEFGAKPGSNTTVARRALRKGWDHPMAWDEHTIDDPGARPHDWQRSEGTGDNWYDQYEEMCAMGFPDRKIADHLGTNLEALKQRLTRRRKMDESRPAAC